MLVIPNDESCDRITSHVTTINYDIITFYHLSGTMYTNIVSRPLKAVYMTSS